MGVINDIYPRAPEVVVLFMLSPTLVGAARGKNPAAGIGKAFRSTFVEGLTLYPPMKAEGFDAE